MAALDIRVGDVVRLHNGTVETYDQTLLTISIPVGIGFTSAKFSVHRSAVAEIISRAETDAEKIARLEAENAELKARLEPKPLWYPPFDDRFGPWIDGPPPLGRSHTYQILLAEEREKQCFDDATTQYPELFQMAVAHRVFFGGF